MTSAPTDLDPDAAPDAGDGDDAVPGTPGDPRPTVSERVRAAVRRAGAAVRGLERRWQVAIVLVLALAVAGGVWWKVTRDDLPDGAAFRVGGDVVTSQAVQRRIATLKALYGVKVPASGQQHATFEQDAAKSMAVQIILEDEARSMHVTVPDSQVDAVLQRLISERYSDGGRAAFIDALGKLGATVDQVRAEIRSQILVSKLFNTVAKDVTVSDAEVRTAFLDRRAELGAPVRRSLLNIVVSDRATAEHVLAALRRGTPFATLAAQYSLDGSTRDHGGRLGVVAASQLEPAYAKAAFAARIGGVFGPVRTKYGWNVGMVQRQVAAQPAVFADVRTALKKTLIGEKALKEWRDWLARAIKDHDVEYADEYRPADPDSVPDLDQAGAPGTGATN